MPTRVELSPAALSALFAVCTGDDRKPPRSIEGAHASWFDGVPGQKACGAGLATRDTYTSPLTLFKSEVKVRMRIGSWRAASTVVLKHRLLGGRQLQLAIVALAGLLLAWTFRIYVATVMWPQAELPLRVLWSAVYCVCVGGICVKVIGGSWTLAGAPCDAILFIVGAWAIIAGVSGLAAVARLAYSWLLGSLATGSAIAWVVLLTALPAAWIILFSVVMLPLWLVVQGVVGCIRSALRLHLLVRSSLRTHLARVLSRSAADPFPRRDDLNAFELSLLSAAARLESRLGRM